MAFKTCNKSTQFNMMGSNNKMHMVRHHHPHMNLERIFVPRTLQRTPKRCKNIRLCKNRLTLVGIHGNEIHTRGIIFSEFPFFHPPIENHRRENRRGYRIKIDIEISDIAEGFLGSGVEFGMGFKGDRGSGGDGIYAASRKRRDWDLCWLPALGSSPPPPVRSLRSLNRWVLTICQGPLHRERLFIFIVMTLNSFKTSMPAFPGK